MGNCQSCKVGGGARISSVVNRRMTLLVLGLDGAGKSTIIANIMEEEVDDVLPTIGFANASTTIAGCQVQLFDVGGGPRIRGIWKNYYPQSHGIIFVVDASSSPKKLEEAKQVLSSVLREETVMSKPLLIMANKQDQLEALSAEEVGERLELQSLIADTSGQQQHTLKVVGCTGLSGDEERRRRRREIVGSVGGLVREVTRRWEEVEERVHRDTERQREKQEREREERKERVRKIREERERQAALQRERDRAAGMEEKEEEEEESTPVINPFKPISEVIVDATERESRAKQLSQQRIVRQRVEPVHEGGGGGEEETKIDNGGGVDPVASVGSVSSGLSESSDSLTQVTVPSKDDNSTLSGSLGGHMNTPLSNPIAMETNEQPETAERGDGIARGEDRTNNRAPQAMGGRSSRWRKSKFNFLSRLKSHNKIAPSPHSIATTTSTNLTGVSGTSDAANQAWTAKKEEEKEQEKEGEWEEEEKEEEGEREKSSLVNEADMFKGLPELPKHRYTLPPIQERATSEERTLPLPLFEPPSYYFSVSKRGQPLKRGQESHIVSSLFRVHKRIPGLEEQTFTTSVDLEMDAIQADTNSHSLTPNV